MSSKITGYFAKKRRLGKPECYLDKYGVVINKFLFKLLFLFHLNNTNFEFACGTNFDVAFCDCVDETFNQRSLAN